MQNIKGTKALKKMSVDPVGQKRIAIKDALDKLTPIEIRALISIFPGAEKKPLERIIAELAEGKADWSSETSEAREVHMKVCRLIYPQFIMCTRLTGTEMDEKKAERYDILRSGWDLREPEDRKLYKMKELVYRDGNDSDDDLVEAVKDLEKYYKEKKNHTTSESRPQEESEDSL